VRFPGDRRRPPPIGPAKENVHAPVLYSRPPRSPPPAPHPARPASVRPSKAQEADAERIDAAWDVCKERLEPTSSTATGGAAHRVAEKTGSAECDAHLETFDAMVISCRTELGPALQSMQQARDAQAEAFREWSTLDAASRAAAFDAARDGCLAATDALRQSATAMGCSI
jgi:hypothetical protein